MQIDRVLYPITTLGPNIRIGIWTVGCPHKCYNCSNPELWSVDASKEIDIKEVISYISQYINDAEGVTITGGDPFFQPNELYDLLRELRNLGLKDILVYTGYSIQDLKEKYMDILSLIDVLIDGPYVDELNNNVGIMGSSNQGIHILNPEVYELYKDMDKIQRERQNYVMRNKIISVGIPNKLKEKEL